jgi:hypothetical protein
LAIGHRSGQTPAALQNGGYTINNHKGTKDTKQAAKRKTTHHFAFFLVLFVPSWFILSRPANQ